MTAEQRASLAVEARLHEPAFYQSPDRFRIYARLRSEAPVFWHDEGFWVLSRHEDISWLLLQANPPFTAMQGLFMLEARRPDRADARDVGGAQQAGASFMTDPPQHTRFRRLMSGAFTDERIGALRGKAQALADEFLDRLPENEPVNFVEAVSVPYTMGVIAELLGFSRDRWADLRRWTDSLQAVQGGGVPEDSPEWQQAADDQVEMMAFFAQELAARAEHPRDDLLSTVATIEIDGESLSEASQVAAALGVMIAGNVTTRDAISGGMAALAEHPDQWNKLADDPRLIPRAVEELLRWVTPVIHFGRRATVPIVIRDQQISADDFVAVLYESGNRDEDAWVGADTFDIARLPRPSHLALGWGIHRCVGATIAQMEIRTFLDRLREQFSSWELTGAPVRAPSTVTNNYLHVPVLMRRR